MAAAAAPFAAPACCTGLLKDEIAPHPCGCLLNSEPRVLFSLGLLMLQHRPCTFLPATRPSMLLLGMPFTFLAAELSTLVIIAFLHAGKSLPVPNSAAARLKLALLCAAWRQLLHRAAVFTAGLARRLANIVTKNCTVASAHHGPVSLCLSMMHCDTVLRWQ